MLSRYEKKKNKPKANRSINKPVSCEFLITEHTHTTKTCVVSLSLLLF